MVDERHTTTGSVRGHYPGQNVCTRPAAAWEALNVVSFTALSVASVPDIGSVEVTVPLLVRLAGGWSWSGPRVANSDRPWTADQQAHSALGLRSAGRTPAVSRSW